VGAVLRPGDGAGADGVPPRLGARLVGRPLARKGGPGSGPEPRRSRGLQCSPRLRRGPGPDGRRRRPGRTAMPTLLILLLVLPALGAAGVAVLGALGRRDDGGNDNAEAIRWVSLASTVGCLGLAAALAAGYASLPRVQGRIASAEAPKPEF